jgi:hypothetical protein
MNNLPTLRINSEVALPDNDQWQHRFEIKSETSSRIYIISQNKKGRFWGCSCPGWRTNRTCKHLSALSLPGKQIPFEPKIIQQ